MEQEIAEIVLPTHLRFKKVQMYEKYPKGQARGRWKHLKQTIQAENYHNYPPDAPNCCRKAKVTWATCKTIFETSQPALKFPGFNERCGMEAEKGYNSAVEY